MIDLSLSFWALLASGLATFGIDLAASAVHAKLAHFLKNRKLSNYDLLECLRNAYDEALNSLWDDYSPIEEPENIPKEKLQEYLRLARTDRDKAEECLQRLKGCKDQVFPPLGKGIKKTPFTDKEIRHLVTNANGEEERERIMGIISPVLDVCGAPETFKNLVEDLEVGLCFRIIFYLKGKIKTDEKVRSILFFEILGALDCKQEKILEKLQRIEVHLEKTNLPAWAFLDEQVNQLERTIREEGEKTRKHTDERIEIAEEEIPKRTLNLMKKEEFFLHRYELHEALSCFSIENQLDFENRNGFKPKFFREMGPLAVDFKNNRVAPRDDIVPQLIENLQKRNLVIAGEPASGKSIILRWVGYLLSGNNSNVYYIPLKERRCPKIEEIRSLKESVYVLIDDGHLDSDFVRDILHPPSESARVLVATRLQHKPPEMETALPDRLKDWQDEAITIKPVNAIDSIIHTFESHPENNLSIPEGIKGQMVERYGINLWLLSWALETYQAKISVQETDILNKVKDWLVTDYKDALKSEDRDTVNDFARIILLLSTFYQYEIPVDREFVSQFLAKVNKRSKKNIEAQIEILLQNCTIAGDQTFVALHHSKLAEMFLKATSRFPNERPYRNILPHIQPERVFSCYFKDFPQFGCNLLSQIPCWKEGRKLIGLIAAKNKEEILCAIRIERDVWKIGTCVWHIADASKEIGREIVTADAFDKEGLIQKLNAERDIWKIEWCVRSIAEASEKVAVKLVPAVIQKLNEERDVKKIGWCVRSIAESSEEVAVKLVPAVIQKLNEERDVKEIGWCIRSIAESSEEVAVKLVPAVIQKLNKERSVVKIGFCVRCIALVSKDVSRQIVEADIFDKEGLIKKLNEEMEVWRIGECVWSIATVSEEVARKIVTAVAFDKKSLIQKLKKERDIWKIEECLDHIARASKEVARKIVEGLRPAM
jgi:hypothetical protein